MRWMMERIEAIERNSWKSRENRLCYVPCARRKNAARCNYRSSTDKRDKMHFWVIIELRKKFVAVDGRKAIKKTLINIKR